MGPTSLQEWKANLTNYDKSLRPGRAATCGRQAPPDVVEVQMRMVHFFGVNQIERTWKASFYARMWWHDERLAFRDASCIETLDITSEKSSVWRPDVFLPELVDAEYGDDFGRT